MPAAKHGVWEPDPRYRIEWAGENRARPWFVFKADGTRIDPEGFKTDEAAQAWLKIYIGLEKHKAASVQWYDAEGNRL